MSAKREPRGTVLITDAGRGSAIAFIRSLGRSGWRVVATDSMANSIGFRSRYAAHHAVYPNPEHAPDAFVAWMVDIVREQQVDLIVPITDTAILPLSAAAAAFADICTLALPDPDALRKVTDKQQTLDLAESLGIPTPKTRLVTTVEEACDTIASFGFPLVLKPRASKLYHASEGIEAYSVTYANTPEQLVHEMRRFEGRCAVLIQQYCAGVGCGVEVLAHRGKPLFVFQHQRLREVPLTGGASSFRQSVPLDPQLYDYTTRLIQALNWTGLAMVEFKVGAQRTTLMEINGRVWGSLPLAVHSGVDFPRRLVELLLEGKPADQSAARPPETSYQLGVRSRNLQLDMVWIAAVLSGRRRYPFIRQPKRREAVTALLGIFNPRNRFDILSLEDPMPGLAELPRIVRNMSSKRKRLHA